MTPDQMTDTLADRFSQIDLPEPASIEGAVGDRFIRGHLNGEILKRFADWLVSYTDLLPSKEEVMAMADKAITMALQALALKNPVLVRIFGPVAKEALLRAISALYDSIVDQTPEVEV